MSNNTQNTEVLNDLIQINNDRIKGYENALAEVKEENSDLRLVFAEMVRQSQDLKSDLINEVQVLGEESATGTTTTGKIYRAWMDVKAVFTGHDRATVLNNCEFGEDAAQKAYKMALETEGLSTNLNSMISTQKAGLKASHDKIKGMRDMAKSQA
jgi:uncharacterized protein (TIGR02284 family)